MSDYKYREIPVLDDIISTAIDTDEPEAGAASIDAELSDETFITTAHEPVLTIPEDKGSSETAAFDTYHIDSYRIEPAIDTNLNSNVDPVSVVDDTIPYNMGDHQLESNYAQPETVETESNTLITESAPINAAIKTDAYTFDLAESENGLTEESGLTKNVHPVNFDIEAITEQVIQQILPNIEQQLRLLVKNALTANLKTSGSR